MKISMYEIKKLILQELSDLVSTQDTPYESERAYKTNPFQNYARVIKENAARLVEILDSSDDYDRRSLINFKKRELPDLHLALDAIENKINDILKD
jgi:hypothetical protein